MNALSHPGRIRLFVALVVAAAIALALVLIPLRAQADPVTLTGTVTGPTGVALRSEPVTVYRDAGGGTTDSVATVLTSSSGAFSVDGLTPGNDYYLWFARTATTYGQYLGQTSDLSQAEEIFVSNGAGNHSYVTASLAAGGTIAGAVAQIGGGKLAHYTVRAYADDPVTGSTAAGSATTSSSGKYSLAGLEPGNYRLEATDTVDAVPAYAPTFSGSVSTLDAASDVAVVASKTTAYSFTLGKSGSVSGTVTGLHNSVTENVANVRVTAYRLTGTAPSSWTSSSTFDEPSVLTAPNGSYHLSGLTPGYYTLEFSPPTVAPLPPSGAIYGRTFLGGEDEAIDATSFQVSSGTAVTGQDIQLSDGWTVSGTAYDANTSALIPDLRVTIEHAGDAPDQSGTFADTTITDGSGAYSFSNLADGNYVVLFGSNTVTTPGEDITWQRQKDPIVVNSDDVEADAAMVSKNVGLNPTTAPSLIEPDGETVGATLTADPGVWDGYADDTFTYQWQRDDEPIPGATGQSYVLSPGDLDHNIRALVTDTDFEFGSSSSTTEPTGPVGPGTFTQTGPAASASGTVATAQTLTANPGAWSVSGAVFSYLWELSTDGTDGWDPIGDSQSITLTSGNFDDGPYLRLEVTAQRDGYQESVVDVPLGQIQDGTFSELKAPTVTTTASTLGFTPGTWSPNIGYTQVLWTVYGTNGDLEYTINSPTLTRASLVGDYVTLQLTRKDDGMTDYPLALIVAQKGAAPTNSSPFTISGGTTMGDAIDVPSSGWSPAPDAIGYQWQDKIGSTWKSIPAATLSSYTLQPADVGHEVREVTTVSATGYATAVVTTPPTTVIQAASFDPPSPLPMITGSPGIGHTLSASTGSWDPTPTSYKYQWKTTSNGGVTFTDIPKATAASYAVPASLLGRDLRVDVTAVAAGYANLTQTVDAGSVTLGYRPLLTAPKVVATPNLGDGGFDYTVSDGTWKLLPSSGFSYQWYIYDSNGVPQPVFGDTNTVSTDDITGASGTDRRVGVEVTAMAGDDYDATGSGIVLARLGTLAPSNATPSFVDGGVVDGTLAAPVETWGPVAAPVLKYAWQELDGSSWKTLSGHTSSTLLTTDTYFGRQLRVIETASSTGYISATVTSNATTVALAASPVAGGGAEAPSVSGAAVVGGKLTAHPGLWSPAGVTFTYQWTSSGSGIPGATGTTFTVPATDLGGHIAVEVIAHRPGYQNGASTATALPDPVGDGSLVMVHQPTITQHAGKFTVSGQTWDATPDSVSYHWYIVDQADETVISNPTVAVPTYTPGIPIAGDYIYVVITASRTDYIDSPPITLTAQLGVAPTPVDTLSISGTPVDGDTLTAVSGAWSTPGPVVSYQWYRDAVKITGATTASYQQTDADVGHIISVRFLPDQEGYAIPSYSRAESTATTSDVTPAPITAPTVTGVDRVATTLTVHNPAWTVSGLTFTYQWYRTVDSYPAGDPIPGATGASYLLTADDLSDQVWVVVAGSRKYFPTGAAASAEETIERGYPITLTGGVKIPTTGHLGTAISAKVGTWNYLPSSIQYTWEYNDAENDGWNFITGANSITYTPSAADVAGPYSVAAGGQLQLVIYATRPGFDNEVNFTSNPLTITN